MLSDRVHVGQRRTHDINAELRCRFGAHDVVNANAVLADDLKLLACAEDFFIEKRGSRENSVTVLNQILERFLALVRGENELIALLAEQVQAALRHFICN